MNGPVSIVTSMLSMMMKRIEALTLASSLQLPVFNPLTNVRQFLPSLEVQVEAWTWDEVTDFVLGLLVCVLWSVLVVYLLLHEGKRVVVVEMHRQTTTKLPSTPSPSSTPTATATPSSSSSWSFDEHEDETD